MAETAAQRFGTMPIEGGMFAVCEADRVLYPHYATRKEADAKAAELNTPAPGHIFAFITGDRVRWEDDDEGNPIEDPIQENGWVDWAWSPYVFHDSRNDVRPAVDVDVSDREELWNEIQDALGHLDGGYEDNGDGTFYAREGYTPFHDNPEGWEYTYAVHFVRKFQGDKGWTEQPWHPVKDGGFTL